MERVPPQGAPGACGGGHASAWISPFWRGPAPEALDTPFTSQDKPPLAIAMVVTLNGVRSLRRQRLVSAQKSKLRLTQEVTVALAPQSGPSTHGKWFLSVFHRSGVPVWLCRGRLPLSTVALCLPQWISGSCPPAPGQEDTLSSGHQRPEDITHTGYPLF